ncbi:MAG: DJ-1/PfpI family protein, partial [Pseudomonadales bacterium]|nr:DJ-1/PfpI family protein [Pseudomonadales bacterium]
MHKLIFVVFDQFQLIDLAGPLQVFTTACEYSGHHESNSPVTYSSSIVSASGKTIATPSQARIETDGLPRKLGPYTTIVVVGGVGVEYARRDARLIQWLQKQAQHAYRICSICNGAFILAESGLLSGTCVATHWMDCDRLQREFPHLNVDRDSIYVRDGKVWTSAGASAGIDLALAIVEDDYSSGIATLVARRLVLYTKRTGNQSQFSDFIDMAMKDPSGIFTELNQWILAHIDQEMSVPVLASHARMSERTFSRKYTKIMGVTPAEAVNRFRAETARSQLQGAKASLKSVAGRCGFRSVEHMNRVLQKLYGV